MSSLCEKDIAFIGFIGSGKTTLLNRVCGTRFPAWTGADSCTTNLQYGVTKIKKITIVDTPGLGADTEVPKHLAGIKVALQKTPLYGIFVIVKAERAAVMMRNLNNILDCFDTKMHNDMRIIITCCDQIGGENASVYRDAECTSYIEKISRNLEFPKKHIFCTGKGPAFPVADVESFIEQTLLTSSKQYSISKDTERAIAQLIESPRALEKFCTEANTMRERAMKCLCELPDEKCLTRDTIVLKMQAGLHNALDGLRKAAAMKAQEMSEFDKNVIYGGVNVKIRTLERDFIEHTNKFLSWDISDDNDPRNDYRHCPHCRRVFNKPPGRGCTGETTCGLVPGRKKREHAAEGMMIRFAGTFVLYVIGARGQTLEDFRASVDLYYVTHNEQEHSPSITWTKKTGCGKKITWRDMEPISKELAAELRRVDLPTVIGEEEDAATKFDADIASEVEAAEALASEKRSAARSNSSTFDAKTSKQDMAYEIAYHGTSEDAAKKIMSSGAIKLGTEGTFGGGFYAAKDIPTARKKMLHGRTNPMFVKVLINLGNALVIDTRAGRVQKYDKEKLLDAGCHSIYAPHVATGPEYAVFDTSRVQILSIHKADGTKVKDGATAAAA